MEFTYLKSFLLITLVWTVEPLFVLFFNLLTNDSLDIYLRTLKTLISIITSLMVFIFTYLEYKRKKRKEDNEKMDNS